ncbi:MAG TPA: 30S ribosomal protein S16 [Thermoanaerobaculia bacterium]|nr:30S ribosomal protein S16 [Thermoanaerobaculia bacterium]
MLKIRLRRAGSKHAPFYRVVVSDSQRTPTAVTVEQLGFYNPTKEPMQLKLEKERIEYWVSQGAQLSATVRSLMKRA